MKQLIKRLPLFVMAIATLSLCAFSSHAGKGDKKKKDRSKDASDTVPFILDHSVELKITSEQVKKLEQLADAEDKVMSDPAIKAIMHKLKAARKGDNEKELAAQKQNLEDKIKEKTGGQISSFKTALGLIFSPEQMKTYQDLRGVSAPKDPKDPKSDPAMPGKSINPFEL